MFCLTTSQDQYLQIPTHLFDPITSVHKSTIIIKVSSVEISTEKNPYLCLNIGINGKANAEMVWINSLFAEGEHGK